MEGCPPTAHAVALRGCLGDEFAKGTGIFTLRRRPIEPVLLSWLADDALGIGINAGAGAILLGVFVLRINIGKRGLNCIQLVFADTTRENLLAARRRIEAPHSVLADERYRKSDSPPVQ